MPPAQIDDTLTPESMYFYPTVDPKKVRPSWLFCNLPLLE
jgi:hypothetical protein